MRTNYSKNKKRGFLVAEVLVASAIITVAVLSAMSVAQKSIAISSQSLNTKKANLLLEEGAEAVRLIRDNDWQDILSASNANHRSLEFSGSSWSATSSPEMIDGFTRSIRIENVKRNSGTGDISDTGSNDQGTKLVTITVEWSEGGSVISKELSFYLTNIFNE